MMKGLGLGNLSETQYRIKEEWWPMKKIMEGDQFWATKAAASGQEENQDRWQAKINRPKWKS